MSNNRITIYRREASDIMVIIEVHVSYLQNTSGSLIDSYDWCVYYTLHSHKESTKTNKMVVNPLEYEPVNVQDKPVAAMFGDSKVIEGISFAPCEAYGRHHIDRH